MSINDLSDNGKSFEFGYNSENDAYGYYKNGMFTEFGGGGLSTQCLIKGAIVYASTYNGGIKPPFHVFSTDGNYYVLNTPSTTAQYVQFLKEKADFVSDVTAGGTWGDNVTFTVSKSGLYITQSWGSSQEIALQEGDSITIVINSYGSGATLLYCGIIAT